MNSLNISDHREPILWVLFLLVGLVYAGIQYSGTSEIQLLRERYKTYQNQIQEFQQLRKTQNQSTRPDKDPLSLSRLDRWAPKEYVSELTPLGETDRGKERFTVRLEASPSKPIVEFLRTIESQSSATVTSFRMERISTSAKTFDAVFQLENS